MSWCGSSKERADNAILGLQVDKDLKEMLVSPDAPPPKVVGLRIWPKAIPQFNVGHAGIIEVISFAGVEGTLRRERRRLCYGMLFGSNTI